MNKLIDRFKTLRKRKYLSTVNQGSYAFIGLGMHSINNLLPVVNYGRLHLKYIVTRSEKNAQLIDQAYPHSIGTNDYQKVLDDPEVKGVFISSNPLAHYELVKKALKADKMVFVEKPPCMTLEELNDLIAVEKKSKGTCMVGLQKQHAPFNQHLKLGHKETSYNYRFVTGYYPEGDPVIDLFIHPLSLVLSLFGPVTRLNIEKVKTKNAETVFLQLIHENENVGSVELSTNYSWQDASEKMIINTPKRVYEVTDSEDLKFVPKQGSILNIPKEKIWKSERKNITLQRRHNFVPVLENNQLFSSGYVSEINSFVDICEGRNDTNNTPLSSCVEVYKLMNKIKNTHV